MLGTGYAVFLVVCIPCPVMSFNVQSVGQLTTFILRAIFKCLQGEQSITVVHHLMILGTMDAPNMIKSCPFKTAHPTDIEPEHLLNHFLRLCIKTTGVKSALIMK